MKRPIRTHLDARRAIESDPTLLKEAREEIQELELPGTPSLRNARLLQANGLPEYCGSRRVLNISIQDGRPDHGELRSDDHISRFEVAVHPGEVRNVPNSCPECDETRVVYQYRAHHHIAGSESVVCLGCDETLYAEEWG